MSRIFSWLRSKNNSSLSGVARSDYIKSLIVLQEIKEFSSFLQRNDDRTLCIDGFFNLLPTISDELHMFKLFTVIKEKSRLSSTQLSTILVNKLSHAVLNEDFDLFQKILNLPTESLKISLPTYETIQLIHRCSNRRQLITCLTILITKNRRYDSKYLLWILLILFEHFQIGDEVIIEYILTNMIDDSNILLTPYGNSRVTPLMLFFHLYSNSQCQSLIDNYLSNIKNQSKLLECDQWNRSYLTHLLCGQCKHDLEDNEISVTGTQMMSSCPNAPSILSKFSMLHKLGNKCDTPIKTIFTSDYCLSLQMILFDYLLVNDSSFELKLDELFIHMPTNSISRYSVYLERLIHNRNLNEILLSVLLKQRADSYSLQHKVRFLLQQGARIDNMTVLHSTIINLLLYSNSELPFVLLDYSFYTDISFSEWSIHHTSRMNLYICRILQCGYPSEFRAKFNEFKSDLSQPVVKLVEQFINLKNPSKLSKLCMQKLRGSMIHLGDKSIEKLTGYIPDRFRLSITQFPYDEYRQIYRKILLNR